MKKLTLSVLSFIFLLCATVGLVGCKEQHTHSFTEQKVERQYLALEATCTEAEKYYYSCSCGEKGTETFTSGNALGHEFTNYVSDNNATCTQDGTKTAKCDHKGCHETDTIADTGSKLPHTFDKQVANEKYLASAATCAEKAKYYYSCSCGEKGSETFEYGKSLNHSFTNYVSDNNATCTQDGTKTAVCDRDGCNEKDTVTDVGSAKGHTYSEKWTYNETEHWHASTCGHNVEKDRATHTFDENKKCTVCDYITVKPLGLELQSSVFNIDKSSKTGYLKVANAVTDYDFSDKFTVADGARFYVCTDKQCNNKIASKKTDIVAGDNIFYILVTNGNDVASYTITLRRRPLYAVSFNANGGTAVNSQSIEEDAIIPEPVTTRAGYTFISWSYDFTQPIIEDTVITAAWTANTNTAYKVEYYLENLEDNNYTLIETENLQGTTDTTATAEIKTYDHFTLYKNNSILRGGVSGDGSLVLKVYYTRNTYTLSNANTSYGEITNAATKKYGNDKIDSVATEYLGCEFLGWYNGEELLSIAKEYTFTVEYNVIAKFKVKDEMSNFNFNYSVDTCNITGVKDKTVSEIIIPDYVTSIGSNAFRGCNSLASITLPFIGASRTANSGYDKVFGYIFGYTTTSSDSSVSGATYQRYYGGKYYHYYIPASLKTVILSDSVTSIGSYAFKNCSGLTNITIPDSVTSIGSSTFNGCSGLTSVTIPDSVTSIGAAAFSECSCLTSVTIPNSVTSIGDYAFYNCSGLTSVTIPNSVTSIGRETFNGCSGLTSVTIGNSVTMIGGGAFYKCTGLTSVTIPDSVTGISFNAFGNCSGLTSVTIPDSVTSIGDGAFKNCSGLTSVTIGKGVTSIGSSAFEGCSGLTSVTISDSVTSIGSYAFSGCSGLTTVTIGNGITSIGEWAFSGCSGLTSIYYTGDVAGWCGIKGLGNIMSYSRTLYIGGKKVEGDLVVPDGVALIGNFAFV